MRHFFNLIHRWWKEYWGSDDLYVRGARLGRRAAATMNDDEIIQSMKDCESERDDFDRGWEQGCISYLKLRGWSGEDIQKAMGW